MPLSATVRELQFSRPDSRCACLSEPWKASRHARPKQRIRQELASVLPHPSFKGSEDMTIPRQLIQQCGIGVGSLAPPERGVARPNDPGKERKFHRGWAADSIVGSS